MLSTPTARKQSYAPVTAAALACHDAGIIVVPIPKGEKGPRTKNWSDKRPTRDDLIAHFEANPDDNFGILVGPASGIIDVEGDGPEAEEEARELFGGEPTATMTIQSRRGLRRIYRFDDRFAGLEAVVHFGDLEIRLGTGNGHQSLVWGTTDDPEREREHVRRFDPADVAKIAKLPDAVVEQVVRRAPKAAPKSDTAFGDGFLDDLESKIQMPRVLSALAALRPSRADNYTEWFQVACALKSLGESYFPFFDGWSRLSSRYGRTRETWDAIKPDGGITIATLFHLAKQDQSGAAVESQADEDTDWEPLPSISLKALLEQPDEPIVPVVDGLVGRGEVTALIASPKVGKTWLVSQLVGSVNGGIPFLGLEVTQGNVIVYDNELRLRDLRRRFRATTKAMGLPAGVQDRVTLVSLKGKHTAIDAIRDDILGRVHRGEKFHLVTIDSLYKCFPAGTDENSTGDMIHVYSLLEEIADKANCAVVIVHHMTKGNQRGKSNTDKGSGSGVQSRSVDNHATITALPDTDVFVLEASVRNFSKFNPLCIRYQYPLWVPAPEYTPEGRVPATLEDFLATIPLKPANKRDTLKSSRLSLGATVAEIEAMLKWAEEDELVLVTVPEKKNQVHTIQLTPAGQKRLKRKKAA